MRTVTATREIPTNRKAVWGVLADFPNIASWNSGIKSSHALGDLHEGVGAKRHCDFAPKQGVDERIEVWEPISKLVIHIYSTARLPFDEAHVTFDLKEAGNEATHVTLTQTYKPKFGALGALMGKFLDSQFTKAYQSFLSELETAAKA